MFPVIKPFQDRVKNVQDYFCKYTDFKILENTFDDTRAINGVFIKEKDGIADFETLDGPSMVRGRKTYNIWLQFKEDKLHLILRGLVEWFDCSGEDILEIDTDPSQVFKDLTGSEFKGFDKEGTDFRFARISVSLIADITGKLCKIC